MDSNEEQIRIGQQKITLVWKVFVKERVSVWMTERKKESLREWVNKRVIYLVSSFKSHE